MECCTCACKCRRSNNAFVLVVCHCKGLLAYCKDHLLQGYVLDGYPASAQQAELLEGSLTGLDLASERAIVAQASRLAPPPSTSLPDLNRSLPSGAWASMTACMQYPVS